MTKNWTRPKVLMMPDGRQANPYQILLTKAVEQAGAKVIFPQGYRRGLPFFRQVMSREERPDIIHLHWISPYFKGNRVHSKIFYAIKLLTDIFLIKLLRIKLIWTIHNQINHEANFPVIELWMRRYLARFADGIILHSQVTASEISLSYRFTLNKAVVIPHGDYRDYYKNPIEPLEARKSLGLPLKGRVFLYFGLLRRYKGVESLIAVWQTQKELLAEETLLIAGKASEEYEKEIRQLIGASENIILVPKFIEDERIHLFFSSADVAVFPYKKILNSGSLILAMSYGLPIIAPKLGNIPSILGKANWLMYEAEDENGLSAALTKSMNIDLSKLKTLTQASCDHLDWKSIGSKTYDFYGKIIDA